MTFRLRQLCKFVGELLLTDRGEYVFMVAIVCFACIVAWAVMCKESLRERRITIAQVFALMTIIAYGLFLGGVLASG